MTYETRWYLDELSEHSLWTYRWSRKKKIKNRLEGHPPNFQQELVLGETLPAKIASVFQCHTHTHTHTHPKGKRKRRFQEADGSLATVS